MKVQCTYYEFKDIPIGDLAQIKARSFIVDEEKQFGIYENKAIEEI